jgi:hypothetical protein
MEKGEKEEDEWRSKHFYFDHERENSNPIAKAVQCRAVP